MPRVCSFGFLGKGRFRYEHLDHTVCIVYLVNVDTVIQRPHSLEIVLHSLFQFFGDLMQYEKILEIPQFCLV